MKVKVGQSCLTLRPHGLYSLWNTPSQRWEEGMNSGQRKEPVQSTELGRGVYSQTGEMLSADKLGGQKEDIERE